jgi:hypothetical protein
MGRSRRRKRGGGSLRLEPSRVLQLHPEYRMRRLTCREIDQAQPTMLDADPEA